MKRSWCEKATYCINPTKWHSGKDKHIGTVKVLVVAKEGAVGESGMEKGMGRVQGDF